MDWDELAKIKKLVDEHERFEKLKSLVSSAGVIDDATRKSLVDRVGVSHAAQYAAGYRIEADERLRQIAGISTTAATYSAMQFATERLAADTKRSQLAVNTNIGAIAASMRIAEEERARQGLINQFADGTVSSWAAAEEVRLRQLVERALGLNSLSATLQATNVAQSYANQIYAAADGRYLLPKLTETERMLEVLHSSQLGVIQDRFITELINVQDAMLAMQTPWLDSTRLVNSIRGFTELQAIGSAFMTAPAFGDEFAEALRADLGDWRDPITNWSQEIGRSADIRHSLYVERGLNTDLTEFPDDAFDESLSIAGIAVESKIIVVGYGQLTSQYSDSDENQALVRTNAAHDGLQRLELQLRKFIDQSLTTIAGSNWPKHRLPNGVYEKWKVRKSNDNGHALDWPLVAYADFTEYVDIICRTDNWKEAFEPVFQRKESVRESFQRMFPIRLAIAHARPICNADALYFYVEVKRMLEAMVPVT